MKKKYLFSVIFILFLLFGLNNADVNALTLEEIYDKAVSSDKTKVYDATEEIEFSEGKKRVFVAYLDENFNLIYDFQFYYLKAATIEYDGGFILKPGMLMSEFLNSNNIDSKIPDKKWMYAEEYKGTSINVSNTYSTSISPTIITPMIMTNGGTNYNIIDTNTTFADMGSVEKWEQIPIEGVTNQDFLDQQCTSSGKDSSFCRVLQPVYNQVKTTIGGWNFYGEWMSALSLDELYVFVPYNETPAPEEPDEEETPTATTTTTEAKEEKVENPKTGSNTITVIVLVSMALIASVVIFLLTRKNTKFNLND